MNLETRITLTALRQSFRKDLDQARSNLTGADPGTPDHATLTGVVVALTRVDNVLEAMIDTAVVTIQHVPDVPDLIGIPDAQVLARDLQSNGHMSCAQAEAEGWHVTQHAETRKRVDAILTDWRIRREREARDRFNKIVNQS